MNWFLVVRSRKLEFSTPSAIPLNETTVADVVKREEVSQRLIRDFGVDSHVLSSFARERRRRRPISGAIRRVNRRDHRDCGPAGSEPRVQRRNVIEPR